MRGSSERQGVRTFLTHSPLTLSSPMTKTEHVVNALLIGMIAFFGAIAGQGFPYPPRPSVLWTAVVSGLLAFGMQLAFERGVRSFRHAGPLMGQRQGDDDEK